MRFRLAPPFCSRAAARILLPLAVLAAWFFLRRRRPPSPSPVMCCKANAAGRPPSTKRKGANALRCSSVAEMQRTPDWLERRSIYLLYFNALVVHSQTRAGANSRVSSRPQRSEHAPDRQIFGQGRDKCATSRQETVTDHGCGVRPWD